ncbi:MAG: nitroreductase family protein [Acidimicrobiales bacterium]|jgi:nitroreductase|nr:nitroreductase family protein [Acidimicrobiales bacterium]
MSADPTELAAVQAVLCRQRAHRSFTDTPVDEATITDILELATRAPSAQNTQPWHFVVVQDADRRAEVWELASRLWEMGAKDATDGKVDDHMKSDVEQAVLGGFAAAPVSVVVCADTDLWPGNLMDSSIWPAIQNIMTAATAHGLGSALTTIGTILVDDLRAILKLPDSMEPKAVIPIGHPAKTLGSSRREPVRDHAHREEFGNGW